MGDDGSRDDWDRFNWTTWGVTPGASAPDGGSGANGANGASDGMLRRPLADEDEEAPGRPAGGWVARGGVLRWDASDEEDTQADAPLREEARSPWAAEDFDLPLGAPAAPRVRAVRAWLARRRLREADLIGELLLERRRLYPSDEEGGATPAEDEANPLALALAEAQAAVDEYETLLGLLEETRAHGGAQAALIEFHLAVTDRLATLAADPAAPEEFAERALYAALTEEAAAARRSARPPSPVARAEWEGRASAALATRQRVERVTAAEEGE